MYAPKKLRFGFVILLFGLLSFTHTNGQRHNNEKGNGKQPAKDTTGTGNKMKTQYFPYRFVLNSANPATYDAEKNTWVQPSPMPDGQSEVKFNYTLQNKINTTEGWISARMNGVQLLSSAIYPNKIGVIPANTNYTGEFHSYGFAPGTYQLHLYYYTTGHVRIFTPSGQFKYMDSLLAEAVYDYFVPPLIVDNDHDGMDDREETRLIGKFSPYFKFSYDLQDEIFRPTDAAWYIRHSNLLDGQYGPVKISKNTLSGNPGSLLSDANEIGGAASIYKVQRKTNYRLDMDGSFYFGYVDNDGYDWPEIISKGNIGLYAHVTPIPGTNGLVKIEYWQFFAYNRATTGWLAPIGMLFGPQVSKLAGYAGDHAGDWATVQLIVQPADKSKNISQDDIISVFHYHHGNESSFTLHRKKEWRILEGNIKEFIPIKGSYDDENTLQLMSDNQGLFVHPVVYIEWGGHEFWPNTHGSQTLSPKHNGDGKYFYQCHDIPNLGEVDWPLTDDFRTILGFNGYWGSFNIANGNPPGPSLHKQWQWPEHSALRPLIPDGDFEN